jgi:hypothetical protein
MKAPKTLVLPGEATVFFYCALSSAHCRLAGWYESKRERGCVPILPQAEVYSLPQSS